MLFVILIILVISLIFIFKLSKDKKIVLKAFKDGNVIVFGKKGKGKDLLFQYVINQRKKPYYSNIDFGKDYHYIAIKDLETNNTYNDFINDNITIIDKVEEREEKDIYLSDCGIILPSQCDSALHKKYPSLTIYYALSRHLYNSNIHCNSQSLERIFKGLREQADSYIQCKGVIKIFGLFFIKYTYYDKYSSACNDLRPMKKPMLGNKELKARIEQYNATNGEIHNGIILLTKKGIHYNTRAFHQKIFGKEV